MRIWFDHTLGARNRPPADGVVKVELSLAAALTGYKDVHYCVYVEELGDIGRFCSLLPEGAASIQRRYRVGMAANEEIVIEGAVDPGEISESDVFHDDDWLIVTSIHFRSRFVDRLQKILDSNCKLRIAWVCHDMLAHKFAHWMPGVSNRVAPYVEWMSQHASHVFCNSENTERDYRQWAKQKTGQCLSTSVAGWATDFPIDTGVQAAVSGADVAPLLSQPYILFVSSLVPRKNHTVLLDAYEYLLCKGIVNLPKLVFVGLAGIDSKRILDRIGASSMLAGRVVHLQGIMDSDLQLLYQNCLFSLYSSLYEGWGLPVTESLALGKFCLASLNSSIPEAGKGFAEYLPPQDVSAWAHHIYLYATSSEARAQKEAAIRTAYQAPRWQDTARQLVGRLSDISQESVF